MHRPTMRGHCTRSHQQVSSSLLEQESQCLHFQAVIYILWLIQYHFGQSPSAEDERAAEILFPAPYTLLAGRLFYSRTEMLFADTKWTQMHELNTWLKTYQEETVQPLLSLIWHKDLLTFLSLNLTFQQIRHVSAACTVNSSRHGSRCRGARFGWGSRVSLLRSNFGTVAKWGVDPNLWARYLGHRDIRYDPSRQPWGTERHQSDSYQVPPMMLVNRSDLCCSSPGEFYEVIWKCKLKFCEVTKIACALPRPLAVK